MRADARANRAAVVAAATRLIAMEGANVPLSTVAEAAGVGIATLYRHFPTREDLLLAVVLHARDRVLAVLDEHRPGLDADPGITWPRLVRAMAALRLGALLPELGRSNLVTFAPRDLASIRERVFAALDGVLEDVKRAGLVRTDVSALRFHLGLAALTRPLAVDIPEAAGQEEWLTEVYLRGLAP